jgi:O-methyltransferase
MLGIAKKVIRKARGETPPPSPSALIPEATPEELAVIARCRPFTMTSIERLWAVIRAVQYVTAREIQGDFVECGVWRGGSSMAAALTYQALGRSPRLWLYDTYEGMTAPTDEDRLMGAGEDPQARYARLKDGEGSDWCRASIEDVRNNLSFYPDIEFVRGKVEDTLPVTQPDRIAILRLDTDWYASTKVELETLWPRLSDGGVLILDDYGHWGGHKQAVDEFFADKPPYLMHRTDDTGRVLVKA